MVENAAAPEGICATEVAPEQILAVARCLDENAWHAIYLRIRSGARESRIRKKQQLTAHARDHSAVSPTPSDP